MKPIDFNITEKQLDLYPYQQLYFTRIHYGMPVPLFPQEAEGQPISSVLSGEECVLLVTGIASPQPLVEEVQLYARQVKLLPFADHHDFSDKDLQLIEEEFSQMEGCKRLIITTEKDGARLKSHPSLSEDLKPYIHVIPIEVEFLLNQQNPLTKTLLAMLEKFKKRQLTSRVRCTHIPKPPSSLAPAWEAWPAKSPKSMK